MRTKKELGDILLENRELFNTGLCTWINRLYINNLIHIDERRILFSVVHSNKPKRNLLHNIYNPDKITDRWSYYYWKPEFIEPRIKWIKKYLK